MRTSLAVQPHLYIGDVTGKPLDYGVVYFGEPNKDPEFYPVDIFYDEALTIRASQPVRTKGGFLNANGDMVEVYAAELVYSVKVVDAQGYKIFYKPAMSRTNTDTNVSTRLPYPDSVLRNQGEKNAESISFEDFLDTNNVTAVQAAFSTRRALTLQNKVYDMGDAKHLTLTAENSNSVINGNGATLKFNAPDYKGGIRIYISGSEESLPAVAANVPAGSSEVSFAAPHGLKLGDVFAIRSEKLTDYQGTSGAVRRIGELLTVAKVVSATTVITHESTVYDYLISDGAAANKYLTVSNVKIRDLKIVDTGLDPAGATIENQRPIHCEFTKNITIDNVTTEDAAGLAITFKNSIGWTVKNCYLSQPQIDDIVTFSQYGIAITDYSRGGRIQDVTMKGFKEAVSFTESGVGYGLSLDTKISGIIAFDCSRVINMHATTRYVDVDGVYANNCTRGMNIRCADVKIRNFRMTRPKTFQSQGASLFVLSNVVRDLDIADCYIENSFAGIRTESLGTNFAHKNIKIKDVTFKGVTNTVIDLDFTTGSTADATGLVVSNNTFEDCAGTRMIIKGRFKNPVITDNKYGDATVGSYGLDAVGFKQGVITNNVFGANLIPIRFVDENGMTSTDNWVENNNWERAVNLVSGSVSAYVAGLKNNRIGNGYQIINSARISSTGSFDIIDGLRYLPSIATAGSIKRINNGNTGDLIVIRATSGSLTLTTDGNLKLSSTAILDTPSKTLTIVKDADGNWYEVSRSA